MAYTQRDHTKMCRPRCRRDRHWQTDKVSTMNNDNEEFLQQARDTKWSKRTKAQRDAIYQDTKQKIKADAETRRAPKTPKAPKATSTPETPKTPKKRGHKLLGFGISAAVIIVLFIVIGAFSGGDDTTVSAQEPAKNQVTEKTTGEKAETNASDNTKSKTDDNTNTKPKAKTTTPIAEFKDELNTTLGNGNRDNVKRIKNIKLADNQLTVAWAINDNFSEDMIITGANGDVLDILTTIKETPDLKYNQVLLQGSFSMQDKFGNASEDMVYNLGYSKARLNKMNLNNLTSDDVVTLTDGAGYIAPAFRQ